MKYIIIIDDSPTIRTSVEFTLKDIGFGLMHAENGIDALNKIQQLSAKGDEVAMCIVDINMPQMDGISFIKKFRENDKFAPIIVLTTEAEEEKIQEGKKAGASGWMIKPFKAEQLQSVVHKFLR
ncbi:MAG: response regulator [Spirochaetes bacterium]|nr:response regulator [Spirochaetota bacterium]